MGFFKSIGKIAAPLAGYAFGGPMGAIAGMAASGGMGGAPKYNAPQMQNPYQNVGKYMQPYMDAGNAANKINQPIYQSQAQDPAAFMQNLMRTYSPSAGFGRRRNNMMQAMTNSQNAAGTTGTQYGMGQQAEMADSILSDDMNSYLNNLLNIQGTGTTGLSGIGERGWNAANTMSGADVSGLNYMNNVNQHQAMSEYFNRNNRYKQRQQMIKALMNGMGGSSYGVSNTGGDINSARGFF